VHTNPLYFYFSGMINAIINIFNEGKLNGEE